MDPKSRFHAHFHDSVSLINDQITALQSLASVPSERQEAIDHILASIAKLQNEVADAAEFTPSYDRRQYADTVKSLQDALNSTIAKVTPKSRFQFKRPAVKPSPTAHVDMGSAMNDPRLNPKSASSLSPPLLPSASPITPSTSTAATKDPSVLHLTSLSSKHICLSSSSTHSSASLTSLQRCIVDLSHPTLQTPLLGLALSDISSSLIIIGDVSGPVHITSVSNSIIVVSARQVRIHECKDVDIYLHCSSHPIIEDCSGMRFAPLSAPFITSSDKASDNQWDQVDDFKWLKAGPSPNWTTISEAERLTEATWTSVPQTELSNPGSVEETLRRFHIQPRKKRNSSSAGSNHP